MPGMSALESRSEPSTSRKYTQGLVSIITPSLNAAAFIGETMESVASQDYPYIEHIVVDGGSTDGTLEILAQYSRATVITGKDRGAADAINRGALCSRGEFIMWLNSDDILMPGAISAAVRALQSSPEDAGVYGNATWIDDTGSCLGPYPVEDFDPQRLRYVCFICQPASMIRASAFENVGGLNPEYDLTFDYEFWMRLTRTYTLRRIQTQMACSRMHPSNKTLGKRGEVFLETFRVLSLHYGYIPFRWVYSYLCYRADGRDQFFEPLQPSVARYLESLPLGLRLNPREVFRYIAEWSKEITFAGIRRRLINP
jgi:glycosyltransferase involved in cell wall biosynthesis